MIVERIVDLLCVIVEIIVDGGGVVVKVMTGIDGV